MDIHKSLTNQPNSIKIMKIKRINLAAISEERVDRLEMDITIGGKECSCACHYEDKGGSSTQDNKMANYASGYYSTGTDSCGQHGFDDTDGDTVVIYPKAL